MTGPWAWAAGFAAVAAVAGGIWWHGHATGAQAEAARHEAARAALQARLFDLADRHSAAAAELAAMRAAQDDVLRGFEDAARDDPGAAVRSADPASLRQLEQLWQRARATP